MQKRYPLPGVLLISGFAAAPAFASERHPDSGPEVSVE